MLGELLPHCCGNAKGSSAQRERRGRYPTACWPHLLFQDAKTHRTALAEHVEVQKRGNHGTLSAQLHNEKSNPLVVSILHVMFRGPVAEPRPRSTQLSLPACNTPRLGRFPTNKKNQPETKQLINSRLELSMEKKERHYVS